MTATPRRIRVDVRGGTLGQPKKPVLLPDGTEVELRVDPRLHGKAPTHGTVFVDEAACGAERLREPPERRVAWLLESPAHGFIEGVARFLDGYRAVLTFDVDLLASGAPAVPCWYGTNTAQPSSAPKDRLVSMVASLENRFVGHRFRLAALPVARARGVECFGRGHRPVAGKNEALDAYAFSVAIENCRRDDYFTEKLVDCLVTETVPIYWGFPSLGRVLDPRGVLCFGTLGELDGILGGLSMDLYERMRPHVLENKRRVAALGLDVEGFRRRGAAEIARALGDGAPRRPSLARRPWPVRKWLGKREKRRRRDARKGLTRP